MIFYRNFFYLMQAKNLKLLNTPPTKAKVPLTFINTLRFVMKALSLLTIRMILMIAL